MIKKSSSLISFLLFLFLFIPNISFARSEESTSPTPLGASSYFDYMPFGYEYIYSSVFNNLSADMTDNKSVEKTHVFVAIPAPIKFISSGEKTVLRFSLFPNKESGFSSEMGLGAKISSMEIGISANFGYLLHSNTFESANSETGESSSKTRNIKAGLYLRNTSTINPETSLELAAFINYIWSNNSEKLNTDYNTKTYANLKGVSFRVDSILAIAIWKNVCYLAGVSVNYSYTFNNSARENNIQFEQTIKQTDFLFNIFGLRVIL